MRSTFRKSTNSRTTTGEYREFAMTQPAAPPVLGEPIAPPVQALLSVRQLEIRATSSGAPARTCNPFFGVGPITDMARDEIDSRRLRFEFDAWIERQYEKLDDRGNAVGNFTTAELARGMHRGYPADKVLLDMMRAIHGYFEFPARIQIAVGLGGGHSGFTAAVLHMVNANDRGQVIFVDTPRPETDAAATGGFFRQSWGAQLIEMHRYARSGDESRVRFAATEGEIPCAAELMRMGVKLFIGVGHETTGATTYTDQEVANLLEWVGRDPANHHAIIDATSLLGAMPWNKELAQGMLDKCCLFMPFQKAIGGISGYYIITLTPQALGLIDRNQVNPAWAIPRQLKIAVPEDVSKPLSSARTTRLGPLYDPVADRMRGGIINTFSVLAFAETTFGLSRTRRSIGPVGSLNARSVRNRDVVNDWVKGNPPFEPGVAAAGRRGAAVTLLRVNDPDVTDPGTHRKIIEKSKQLLGYAGITHPNGDHEPGLDVARYVNAFPGTPGDYRAWIGGIRPQCDVEALLDNIAYAYRRAKIVVLEEELARYGIEFPAATPNAEPGRCDDPSRAYKVLILDLVGLRLDARGEPDPSEVAAHIDSRGGVFHHCGVEDAADLEAGRVHFFYQPRLSTPAEIEAHTASGQYDAVIVAATILPATSVFRLGGVRIGAGTGNMCSASWGGGSGRGGTAPLMNTPSFNSRATAQMVFKALLRVCPDLAVDTLYRRVADGDFDTGRNLREYPTEKLEGKRIAILGYGNIGREVAKLARAFRMQIVVYARPGHRDWIESEGLEYAASVAEAARGANVLSLHLGLGAATGDGRFANSAVVGASVFNALADGAIVINYDRGELIDVPALDQALQEGKVRHAAVDADLFRDPRTAQLSGPLLPYRRLLERHRDRMELLPHAAADTDHLSRVEGARQAVDQIMEAIRYRRLTNLVGDVPAGFVRAGTQTVKGVGRVRAAHIASTAACERQLADLRSEAEFLAGFWGAVQSTRDPGRRQELIDRYGARLLLCANRHSTRLADLGLQGPYDE